MLNIRKKPVVLLLLIAACLIAILFVLKIIHSQRMPNIILMSIDTLRADHLGCYGYGRETSPYIDNFSKDSVVFKKAISQAPLTTAAHMSIFTSLSPAVHGITNTEGKMAPVLSRNIPTLAEVLKKHGYICVGFHGGGHVRAMYGFDKGFDLYKTSINWTDAYSDPTEFDKIRHLIKKADQKKSPFFLFLHHYKCHDPYLNAPQEFLSSFSEDFVKNLPQSKNDIDQTSFQSKRKTFWNQIDMKDTSHRNHVIALYDGTIRYSDYLFEQVMNILKEEDCYDNSIIILLSDHGEEFYEHGSILHEKLFIETLHVPLIIKFPHQKHAGTIIQQYVRTFDLMPTLLDFININEHIMMQGVSLMNLLVNKSYPIPPVVSYVGADETIRVSDGEYIYSNQDHEWLFDTSNDLAEQNNLASSNFLLCNKMREKAQKLLLLDKETKKLFENNPPVYVDEETLRELKSLGYIQ